MSTMTTFFEAELEGDEALISALTFIELRAQEKLRDLVGGWASYTLYWMRLYVPVETTYTVRHTDSIGPYYRPGGAGGGGTWESVVGVKAGDSKHPLYVNFGTGIYAGRGLIRAKQPGGWVGVSPGRGVLTFQKRGEPRRFRYWVRGQKPRNFLYASYQQARIYANARIHTLGRELVQTATH